MLENRENDSSVLNLFKPADSQSKILFEGEKQKLKAWEKQLHKWKDTLEAKSTQLEITKTKLEASLHEFSTKVDSFNSDQKEFAAAQAEWRKRRTLQADQLHDSKIALDVAKSNLAKAEKNLNEKSNSIQIQSNEIRVRLQALETCESTFKEKENNLSKQVEELKQRERDLEQRESLILAKNKALDDASKNVDMEKANLAKCEYKIKEWKILQLDVEKKQIEVNEVDKVISQKLQQQQDTESRLLNLQSKLFVEQNRLEIEALRVSKESESNSILSKELTELQNVLENQRNELTLLNSNLHEKATKLAQTKQILAAREERIKEQELDVERLQERVAKSLHAFSKDEDEIDVFGTMN